MINIEQFSVTFYKKLTTEGSQNESKGAVVALGARQNKYGCQLHSDGCYYSVLVHRNENKFYTTGLIKAFTERNADISLDFFKTEDGVQRFELFLTIRDDSDAKYVGCSK